MYQFDYNSVKVETQQDDELNASHVHPSLLKLPGYEFVYTSRGHLIIDGYTFSRSSSDGRSNTVYWRCTASKKHNCKVALKTMEKQATYIRGGAHTHPAPRILQQMQALPWTDS